MATCFPAPAAGDIDAQAYRRAVRDLGLAVRGRDPRAFVDAASTVLRKEDRRTLRAVVRGYAELGERLAEDRSSAALARLHNELARELSELEGRRQLPELERLVGRGRHWRTRVLALDTAALHPELDVEEAALRALRDEHAVPVRRSLRYLAEDRNEAVVEALVERYVELEDSRPRGDRDEWERTLLAFRSTLHRLLGVDLPAAVDYRNYVDTRLGSGHLFDPPEERPGEGRTAPSLFGTAVTGRNVAFVLDVSGSMMTTDPAPPGEDGGRGRTVVGEEGRRKARAERLEARRRITRAKKELQRVIRSLPEDVRFNIIAYSSDVQSWKDRPVRASDSAKEDASRFVEGLRAEGVTVTDLALEEAFSHLELDTVYLLTDGAPTHRGTRGRGLPPDAERLMEAIHERIRVLNFLRGVRVFTLGFRGAEVEFLRKLAEDHGGRFAAIR